MSLSASSSVQPREHLQFFDGLASSALCADLDVEAVLALSRLARLKTYAALQEAVTEGQDYTEIEIVSRGRFVVLLPSEQIDLHATGSFDLHLYLPGDCFGLSGMADRAPAAASIIASEPSTTISIATAGLHRVLNGNDAAAAAVYRNLFAIQTGRLGALGAH